MEKQYLTCAETAKLVRKELKKHFPKTKFSVRSNTYSMGASIDVKWKDGPTCKQVESVVSVYGGKGFDGSIDLAYYITAYILPNGEVITGNCEGTQGSGGYVPSIKNEIPEGAREVSFGADYIHTNREISIEHELQVAEKLALQYDVKEPIEIAETEYGPYIKYPNVMIYNTWFNSLVHQWFSKVDLTQ